VFVGEFLGCDANGDGESSLKGDCDSDSKPNGMIPLLLPTTSIALDTVSHLVFPSNLAWTPPEKEPP
jgi:hypothetical protein